MSKHKYVFTDKGLANAIMILGDSGLLPESYSGGDDEGLLILNKAANEFLRRSRELGDRRTKEDLDKGFLISAFLLWTEEMQKRGRQ